MTPNWPDFPDLLSVALERFRFNWKHLLGLNLLSTVGGGIISTVIVYLVMISLVNHSAVSFLYIGLILLIIIFSTICIALLYGTLMQVLAQSESIHLRPLFIRSVHVLPHYLAIVIASIFLVGGAFGLLFLPGIAVSFLLASSLYELLLFEATPLLALKNSIRINGQHWRQIIVYHLPLIAIYFVYSVILSIIKKTFLSVGMPTPVFAILQIFVSTLFGIFSLNLSFVIYLEARHRTDGSQKISLIPYMCAACIGWLIIGYFVAYPGLLPVITSKPTPPPLILQRSQGAPFGTIDAPRQN